MRGAVGLAVCGVVGAVHGFAAGEGPSIEVLAVFPLDIPVGELTPAFGPSLVTEYRGRPKVSNDGGWWALGAFPVTGPDTLADRWRQEVLLRNGEAWIRAGLQLPSDAGVVPARDKFRNPPFDRFSVAGDGTTALVTSVREGFSLLADGTPDPATVDSDYIQFPKTEVLLVNGEEVLRIGDNLSPVTGIPAQQSFVRYFAVVEAVSSDRLLVVADLHDPGSGSSNSRRALFEVTDPGGPEEARRFLIVCETFQQIPGLPNTPYGLTNIEGSMEAAVGGDIVLGATLIFGTGLVLHYDASEGLWAELARSGRPSLIAGRDWGGTWAFPKSVNDAGDVAFIAGLSGSSTDNVVIVRNGSVLVQKGMTVGTAAPGPLDFVVPDPGLEMDTFGNVVWHGGWTVPKASVCPDNVDIPSSGARFEGLFFNDQLLVESGVTTIRDVTVNGVVYPELVIAYFPDTGHAGFHMSEDGRWLVFGALVGLPSNDLCDFTRDRFYKPFVSALMRIDLDEVRGGGAPGRGGVAEED